MSVVTVNLNDLFKTKEDYKKYTDFCKEAGFKPYTEKEIETMKKGKKRPMK